MNEVKNNNETKSVNNASKGKEIVKSANSKLVARSFDYDNLDFLSKDDVARAKEFLSEITNAGDKAGFKTPREGLAILMRARDLQLPFSSCIEHIHVINGKTGIDVHLIKALLLRAGVLWECIDRYAPLYEYTDGFNVYDEDKLPSHVVKVISESKANEAYKANKDSDVVYVYPVAYYKDCRPNVNYVYPSYNLNSQMAVCINAAQIKAATEGGKVPIFRVAAQPKNYVYTYKFTRVFADGRIMTALSSFSISDALAAGIYKTNDGKSTWEKYTKVMLSHRAFVYGARDIGSDLLFGVMETNELRIIENYDAEYGKNSVVDIQFEEI